MKYLTFVEKGKNTVGTIFGLAKEEDGTFGVWTLKENYAGHVRGGIAYTWCYCARNLDEQAARAMFAKKLKGKAK